MKKILGIITILFAGTFTLIFLKYYFTEDFRYKVEGNFDDDFNVIGYEVEVEETTELYNLEDSDVNLLIFTGASLSILSVVYVLLTLREKNKLLPSPLNSPLDNLNKENEFLKKQIENNELKQRLKGITSTEIGTSKINQPSESSQSLNLESSGNNYRLCPKCSTVNENTYSFCSQCGFNFAATPDLNHTSSGVANPMASMMLKTGLKLLIIFSALIACTFIYSFLEDSPPKVFSYFISTFIISIIIGIIVLLFGRLVDSTRQSFISLPYKVILTSILMIGLARIIGAHTANNQFSELSTIDNEPDIEIPIETFTNSEYGVSFNYPSNWTPQTPQRQSTLILLYDTNGSQATCNLSVITQDQKEIQNYNADYFKNNLSKVYKAFDNVKTNFTTINNTRVSWTTYDFLSPTNTDNIPAESITLTTLHNGQRVMLIINVPMENRELIKDDIRIITGSLTLINK